MIDNDPSKSVRPIDRVIGMSEFLIMHIAHKDIQYSLYKMKKGQFLSQTMKDKS